MADAKPSNPLSTERHGSAVDASNATPTSEKMAPNSASPTSSTQEEAAVAKTKEEAAQPEPEQTRSRSTIILIMFSLMMAVFLAALDITIITTALPTIAEYFDSPSGYTWVGSAFLLAQASATPAWSKFSDIFGRKPVILLANFIFFVGSLICGVSVSIGMLITGRAIQGVGAGGLLTLASICIGDLFSPRQRGGYYGMIGAVWYVT